MTWEDLGEPGLPTDMDRSGGSRQELAQQVAAGRWLVLAYKVPPEPSRLRAMVWRRLKGLGAIYLQRSAAALPASARTELAMRKLQREIIHMPGSAILLSCEVLAGEAELRAALQAARDEEYEEIRDKCADFIAGLDKEYAANHFTYAELEENEVDLIKLRKWLKRVRDRDAFSAEGLQSTLNALGECERKLDAFAAEVYNYESARI